MAARRLATPILSAVVLACMAALPVVPAAPAHIDTKPAAAPGWLNELNTWRASTGLSNLTENSTWSAGDYSHGLYMVKNDLVTHYETPGVPYYTTAGDTAAQDSNIYVSSTTATTDEQSIDWWMQAPFHAMGLMDPRLVQTGFGSYREVKSGWQMGAAVDVLRGNSFSGGQYPVYFPGNGTSEPLTSYGGGEFPDPLQACPGYSVPTGLPVFVQVGGGVSTTAGAVHSFTGNGVALAHCVIDSTNAALGSYLRTRGGVILIPRQPLQNGVTYKVNLTVNGAPYAWSFTVGPFITSHTPCTSVGLGSDKASPQNPGTAITFTATSTGCPNPQYLYYLQDPSGAWNLVRGYGGPTWTWDTSTWAAGNYVVNVWVRDTGSGVDVQVNHLLAFTVAPSCTAVGLTPDKPSPQQVDNTITFSATSSGCLNPEYLFYLQSPNGAWTLMRGYGAATWSWDTSTVASIGAFVVNVWVRPAGSKAALEANALFAFTVTNRVCSAAALSVDSASPQAHGAVIKFTASSSGCARPEYLFYLKGPGLYGAWSVAQSYGGAAWSWPTAEVASIGTYEVNVWVRAVGSAAPLQTNTVMYYTLS